MDRFTYLMGASLLAAVLYSLSAVAADEAASAGRKIFEDQCMSCHDGASPSKATLGPSLVGIVGRKAGTEKSGVHSRAALESGIVWDRNSLRRYLFDPGREIPGTIMPVRVEDPKELDELLNYLESLH